MVSMWNALEGVTVAERYELQSYLATGGMAAVYRAWDHRLARPVAIKVLRQLEDAEPRAIERFRREARAAAALRSPHIVEVYDFVEDYGCHYLVMELVDGINFKQQIVERGPLAPDYVVAVAMQICRALQAAHEHGFIHRDIKPQNVLLAPAGLAKLTDFGIVHLAETSSFTTGGIVLGTADYISPEQAQGFPLAPTTDIYSLGVVMYEALTSALPFTATTPVGVATLHATTPPAPLRQLNPSVPREIAHVVMRTLRKDPGARYASAREMEAALAAALTAVRSAPAPSIPDEAEQNADEQPTDLEWRTLAELLRRPNADSPTVAAVPPVHAPSTEHAPSEAESEAEMELSPAASSGTLATRPPAPGSQFSRLLAVCGVAAVLVVALMLLHLAI